MGKLSVLAILMLLMSSCAKTVEVVVKNEAGMPYIGAQVYVFSENIPEIEKCVMLDAQWRQQNELEERFVLAGLSYKEAKVKAKEQYDGYHEERPNISPYSYVTHEMRMESSGASTEKITNLLINGNNVSGITNASGALEIKLKEGDYYVYIEGDSNDNAIKYYGPLHFYDEKTKVYTLK